MSVLLAQFPSLYYGLSKQGYPVCYFNAGRISVEGVECVTDPELLGNVIWHYMMHDLKYRKFPEAKKRRPGFKRYVVETDIDQAGILTYISYLMKKTSDKSSNAITTRAV